MKKPLSRVTLLLILALLIGITAGCDNATPTATPTTTASNTTGNTTANTEFPNLNPPGQLPVVKEKEKLRLVVTQNPQILSYKYGKNKLTTWLQDRTNVEIEFILFPQTYVSAMIDIELSVGGDLGDAVRLESTMSKSELMTFGSQGAIMDLTDLLDTYSYNIKSDLDKQSGAWEANTAPDGGIYALPTGPAAWLVTNAYGMRHWIHKDFLAKYEAATGKGMPTTTDEYFDYMVWCRDNDPNGNGANDEIGWSGSERSTVWNARPTDFLMHAFTWNTSNGFYQRADKIHANFVEDEYREGLRYLNKMMEEGLMDENYPSNDENQLQTLVAQNGGNTVASGSWGSMYSAATDNRIRNLYQIVAPLKGPDGFQNASYNYNDCIAKPGPVIIPANSAKPELAIAWFDSCYDAEVSLRQLYGEKGVDWDVPDPSERAVDGGPGIYKIFRDQWNVPTNSHWSLWGPSLFRPCFIPNPQPEKDVNGNEIHDLDKSLYDATVLYEKNVTPCPVPDFYFEEAKAIKANEYVQRITDQSRAAITEFIFGIREIDDDKAWAEYKAEIEVAGLSEYLKMMQDEYDRNWVGTMPQTYTPFPPRT